MAKGKIKKTAKKVIKKVLDKTDLDEKLVAEYTEHKSRYDLILCYIKCYGGYLLAVGAGCTFGVSLLWGTILLAGAVGWAYVTTCGCKLCKGGNTGCCKN
tara:strand:- start:31 stop:330 length:300 start_codon:yes stop_codon:yes gene_type:complete